MAVAKVERKSSLIERYFYSRGFYKSKGVTDYLGAAQTDFFKYSTIP